MEVSVKRITDWQRVVDAARMTVHKEGLGHEPTSSFKYAMLRAEHSPIRLLEFDIILRGVPYYVVMHLVRHNQGIEKFVATSREDRTGIDRSTRKQTDLVDCQFSCNAQALINISRKRMCNKADENTRKVWKLVIKEIGKIEPIVEHFCVPECYYRGFCPEKGSCGRSFNKAFEMAVFNYRHTEVFEK